MTAPAIRGAPQALIDEVWGDCYRAKPHFDGGLVVDIGAGVGTFTLFAEGPVRAVEGHPESALNLRANAPNAEVLQWVVGDGSDVSVRTAGHGIQTRPGGTIRTRTLAEILRGDSVSVLKVDVEGSEYPLLYGADLSNVKYLAVEVHVWTDRPNDSGLGIRPEPMPMQPATLVEWLNRTHQLEIPARTLEVGGVVYGIRA